MSERRLQGGRWNIYESPIGALLLVDGPDGLTDLSFPGRGRPPADGAKGSIPGVEEQLAAYFAGELREFDLRLDVRCGTPLEREVWRHLMEIPYGETIGYGELAGRIDPNFFDAEVEPWRRARIVGAANGRNPISIVVPCHRVIGADGSLVGYGGGLQRKQALLGLERRTVGGERPGQRSPANQLTML